MDGGDEGDFGCGCSLPLDVQGGIEGGLESWWVFFEL